MIKFVSWGAAAFALSFLGVAAIRRWATQKGVLDIPNERSSHTTPTPRGGGLAIVGVTLGGLLVYQLLNPASSWPGIWAYMAGAAFIAGVSWLDDLRSLSNGLRLVVHSLGAVLIIIGVGYWDTIDIPFLAPLRLDWFGALLTFLWIVGMTNAYNFMDGIDGLAGSQAVIAGLSWFILFLAPDLPALAPIALLLAAASLGFLLHNLPPARIFMGDVGSAFLGYSFAALPVLAFGEVPDPRLPVTGVLIMAPFVFDTTVTVIRRAARKENVFQAHQSHVYQRLIRLGYRHGPVAALYVVLAVLASIDGFIFLRSESRGLALAASLGTLVILSIVLAGTTALERRRASRS